MKAMRQWPGWALPCLRHCCGRVTSPLVGSLHFSLTGVGAPLGYWLVYPNERRMVPKVKRFREWLVAEMARAVADLDGGWSRLNAHLTIGT